MERKLTVLYGSQTGTAQDLAEHVWRESKRFFFTGTVTCMNKYNIEELINENFVIFVCSTTGQGDEPDNMKKFWRFLLRKSLTSDCLNGLNCAVLGLGDSSYEKFNFVAKRLNKRLQQLGANILIPIGLCDDQHDLGASAVYENWLNSLWEKLSILVPLSNGIVPLTETPREFRWNIEIIDNENGNNDCTSNIYENYRDSVFDETSFRVTVVMNKRTTAENHFQDVRLISFANHNLSWNPGDVLIVRPENSNEQVADLFDIFQEHNFDFSAKTIINLTAIDSEMPVPDFLATSMSLETIAKQLWDLNDVPRARTFRLLAMNCKNELEKEKLLEFASPREQEELFAYVNRPRRTILEVLRDFRHATSQLNLNIFFEIFQFIKTRSFSIASCPAHKSLDLLVAVIEYKTMLSKRRKGLCSNWLKSLQIGDEIYAVIKRGTFKIPNDDQTPCVMVGPGTGLAPFRSFLLEKFYKKTKENIKIDDYLYTLFFGCRGMSLDYHCRDDLEMMENAKLVKIFTAFSRDQKHKIYVQHRIKEQHELLRNQISHKNGVFLVAGNAKNMPKAVNEALSEALNDKDYVEAMVKCGRYQEETWA